MSTDDNLNIEVPDDLSTIDGQPDADHPNGWHVYYRLVLKSGREMMRLAHVFPDEPFHGDVNIAAEHATHLLRGAQQDGYLKFVPEGESMFFTTLDNVDGIFVDVISPDGMDVTGVDLKPGYNTGSND